MCKKGFTLIELIVSITLSLIVAASLAGVMVHIQTIGSRLINRNAALLSSLSALNVMSGEIKGSFGICASSSPARLVLDYGPSFIYFEKSGSRIKRVKDSSTQYLTDFEEIRELAFLYPSDGHAVICLLPAGQTTPFSLEAAAR